MWPHKGLSRIIEASSAYLFPKGFTCSRGSHSAISYTLGFRVCCVIFSSGFGGSVAANGQGPCSVG